MSLRDRVALWAFELLLLAYPRAFRRRFGAEMRADFCREQREQADRDALVVPAAGVRVPMRKRMDQPNASRAQRALRTSTWRTLRTHAVSGLAERWSACIRWFARPGPRPTLYEPAGSAPMFLHTLHSDLRYAIRQARRAPGYTTLAVLALALGIGATSAVFTVVNGVLLTPLPYKDPDRLAMVWSDNRNEGRPLNTVSPANFADYRDRSRGFATLDYALSFLVRLTVSGEENAPAVWVLRTGSDIFAVLGREALLGRTYVSGERDVAVVSHGYWTRQMGRDPDVIGRVLALSGHESVTIVGVMPPDFAFPYRSMFGPWVSGGATTADMWIPMPMEGPRWITPGGALVRDAHALVTVGRLAPGVSLDQARDELATIGRQLETEYPDSNRGWGITVVSLTEQTVGHVRPGILLLLGGVGVLLLMAAVNVANLVLAQSVGRQRELAVRAALGASRGRLAGQALTESVVLASAGGALGLLFVGWGVRALVALAPIDIPRMHDVTPDWRVLAFTLLVAVGSGVAAGLLPAMAAGRADVRATLQDQSRGTVGSHARRRVRAALVIAEVALAVLLTVGAGLLTRSFVQLMNVNPGFRAESLLTLQLNIPDRLVEVDQRRAFYEELLDRLGAIPGVVAVGGTTRIPLGSSSVTTSLHVDGRNTTDQPPEVEFRRVMRDFFPAMGTPLLRGRLFGPEDGPTASSVAVVNETLARRIFGTADPIGQHVRTGSSSTGPWSRIIGVVGDMRHTSLNTEPLPEIYFDYAGSPPTSPFIAIRTTGDASHIAEAVRREARALDRTLALYDMRTMETVRAESVAERRFFLILVTVFGGVALLLATVGVYGVMSLVVSERTAEVGLRLALGARPSAVLRMIVGYAAGLACAGTIIGALMATALAPLLASQLFGVAALDPVTFTVVASLLVTVAIAAALVPAWRAMRVDPISALRDG